MTSQRFSILVLLVFLSACAWSQTILLSDRWQFKTGDNPAYARPDFDDRLWPTVSVPNPWEPQGYDNYDGIAWYRVHFSADDALLGEQLTLSLGKVDDADVTYVNGVEVGRTGKFPPESLTAYQEDRRYPIPAGLLKKENVLAVRVYDMMGPGGVVFGPLGIYNAKDFAAQFNPPPGPKKSLRQLVTSNGLIAAVYNEQRGFVESVRPHIFQAYDSARYVEPFVLRIAPAMNDRPSATRYRGNTHVITVEYPGYEINYFAPFTTDEKIFYAVVSGPEHKIESASFVYTRGKGPLYVDSLLLRRSGGRAEKYFLFGFTDSLNIDGTTVAKAVARLRSRTSEMVVDEERFMRGVVARCRLPKDLSPTERAAAEQSIAVLKMAQVSDKEVIPAARGQVLASLPPGGWNIAWVRDGTYSLLGLNRLGMFDEAKKFLAFMLTVPSGHYVHYRHTDGIDYGVGVPYQISVCRYFAAKEESDFAETTGPNVELDGFGLFLSAFSDYVTRSHDTAFVRLHENTVTTLIGDAILHCIDSTNIIRRDSGPWERHLPGKQFAYTSIACATGLRDLAALGRELHQPWAAKYEQGYERLLSGIMRHFIVGDSVVRGNTFGIHPTDYDYYDGGTCEGFASGLFTNSKLFASHLREYRRVLSVPAGIGLSRINSGDWYETAEWILLDLRVASAYARFGDRRAAADLVKWVTDQASLNFNLLPELYDRKTGFYDGAIPMVGFGAGAYIVALDDLHAR